MIQNIKHKDKYVTTTPDLRQELETCGGVKLVKWAHNPHPMSIQRENFLKSSNDELQKSKAMSNPFIFV